MKKTFFALAVMLFCVLQLCAQYAIEPTEKGCRILENGKVLVSELSTVLDSVDYKYKREVKTLPDGTKVFNLWSTDERLPFRLEVALTADGSEVEISAQTERAAFEPEPYPATILKIVLPPEQLQDAKFDGYVGTGRSDQRRAGVFDDKFIQNTNWRYLALERSQGKTVFDFNPVGVGDWCLHYEAGVIRGVAKLEYSPKGLVCHWPNNMAPFGGTVTLKFRIYAGGMERYPERHSMTQLQYWGNIPADRRYAFASEKHSAKFTSLSTEKIGNDRREGWIGTPALKTTVTKSGVLYSNVSGKNATFRMTGLRKGLHLITFGAGNPENAANKFSVTVNGEELLPETAIANRHSVIATLPVWIESGTADVEFKGDFLVSMLGDQLLLASAEDFTCRRGFWLSEGFEPGIMFRNELYQPKAEHFKPSRQEMALPVTGKESEAAFHTGKHFPETVPAQETDWLYQLKFQMIGANFSNLNELADQKKLDDYMDKLKAEGRTCLMVSGLHSRHTYPDGEKRSVGYIKKICDAAHARGIKVIEHHDVSLVWNLDAGFRALAERIDEVSLSPEDFMPGIQFCLMNPEYRNKLKAYLKELTLAGVDGFQLDENGFPIHGGNCEYCRKAFQEDTHWQIPADETYNWYQDFSLPVTRAWFNWKLERTSAHDADLKAFVASINPKVIFSTYGTLSTMMTSNGLRSWNSNMLQTMDAYDLIGHECQGANTVANSRMFVPGQKLFNFINVLSQAPVYTWLYCEDDYSAYFGYAVTNMNAQVPLFFREGKLSKAAAGGDYLAFNASPDNMQRKFAKPVREVAVLIPGQTRDWDSSITMPESPFGIAQTLEELHIPYQMMPEKALRSEILAQFKVLFLGTASSLSREQISAIREFAEKGGTVMLDTTTATRDQMGVRYKKWPLADIFGFNQPGRVAKASEKSVLHTKKGDVKLSGTALYYAIDFDRELSTWFVPFTIEIPERGKLPGMITKKVGKGKMIYLPMRFGEIAYVPDLKQGSLCPFVERPEQLDFYRDLLREIVGDAALLKTDAPRKVYTTVYRENEWTLIHLLNGTGSGANYAEQIPSKVSGNPFPALEKDITLTLSAGNVKEVFAVSPDFEGRKELSFKADKKGSVTVTLPKELLNVYTIIRMR